MLAFVINFINRAFKLRVAKKASVASHSWGTRVVFLIMPLSQQKIIVHRLAVDYHR